MDKRTLRSKKAKPRNARPYDRQNQSIFGKVYSTVKGLFNPSWMFDSVSQWMGNSEEAGSDEIEETVREDEDVVSQSISHRNKRLRLRFDDHTPSIQNSGTQTWNDPPIDSQNSGEPMPCVTSPSQSSLLEKKKLIPVMNDVKHESFWSSSYSPSTSNFNPSASNYSHPLSNFSAPPTSFSPSTSNFSPVSRNFSQSPSRNFSSPSVKFQRRTPTISHTNQPNFNLSTFVGPSKLSQSIENTVSSPFYEGKTTFGGASASRRMPSSVTPYQVDKNLRNQIKVKENQSNDTLEGMSSAAKRILLTLEKMSTPVADAKKIPNSSVSPVDLSVYLTPAKSRRNSQFTPSISKGPPIANINTIAKLATLKNYGVNRLRNPVAASPPTITEQKKPSLNILQPSASETIVQKSGGGKMKNKLNQHHQSAKETEDIPEPLHSIPLPVTNLPKMSFNLKPEINRIPSSKGFTFSKPIDLEFSVGNGVFGSSSMPASQPYVFSYPIEHELPNATTTVPKESISMPTSQPYVFSYPIEHELPNATLPKESVSGPGKNAAISTVNSSVAHSAVTTTVASFSTTPITANFTATSSTSTWECSTCWVRNPIHKITCLACENPREAKEKAPIQATLPTSTWECSTCWVRNPTHKTNCMACENPREIKEKTSIQATSSTSTWECSACWVKNPAHKTTCMACENPRETKEKTSIQVPNSVVTNSSCSSGSTLKSSTWECSSCWVRNPVKEKKCLACETLHPDVGNTTGLKDSNGYKFSSPDQKSPITFKFGHMVSVPSTIVNSTFQLPSSVFGTATSKSDSTAASGLKISSASESKVVASDVSAIFGSGSSKAEATGPSSFSFGVTSTTAVKQSPCVSSVISAETIKKLPTTTCDSNHLEKNETKTSVTLSDTPISLFEAKRSNKTKTETAEVPTTDTINVAVKSTDTISPTAALDKFFPSNSELKIAENADFLKAFGYQPLSVDSSKKDLQELINPVAESERSSSKSNEIPVTAPSESVAPKTVDFKFGSTTADAVFKSPGFKFGSTSGPEALPSGNISASEFKFGASTTSADLTVQKPTFKFGSVATTKAEPSNSTSESLQTQKMSSKTDLAAVTKSETSSVASVFKFGASTDSQPSSNGAPPTFKFGSVNTSKSETNPISTGFKFNASTTSINASCVTTTATTNLKASEGTTSSSSSTGFKMVNSVDVPATTATSGFSFGGVTPTFGSGTSLKVTEASGTGFVSLPQPTKTDDSKSITSTPFSTAASAFVFGSTSTTSAALAVFGNASTTSAAVAPSAFSFFPSSSASVTPASSVFTFGSSATGQVSKPGGFTFKTSESSQSTPVLSTTSQPAQGLSLLNGSTAPTGGFVFGAAKTETQSASSSTPFIFGSGSTPTSNASAFSAFQPSQPANPAFQFGSQPASTAGTAFGSASTFAFAKADTNQISSIPNQNPAPAFGSSTGTFTFSAKAETQSQNPGVTSQAPMTFGAQSSTFTFGNKNENAPSQNSIPAFGSGQVSSVFGGSAVPTFGAPEKPATGGFTFGVQPSGVFQFGDKKPAAPSGGFTFGTPAAPETNNTFTSGFSMNTPPSFNFGATSTPAAPFQFAASVPEGSGNHTAGNPSAPRKYRKAVRRVLRKD